ncbi:MAG: proline dehydrogenase family protein [Bacteroidia bacterium]|nr:proline dehydrogenase family protein [Bacteroidia bacterium]
MNKGWLVDLGSKMALWALDLHLPIVKRVIKKTVFPQFCGGETLEESIDDIEHLYKFKTQSVLDYGAEAKETEEAYDFTMNQNIKAIQFAHDQESVPGISTKVTGLCDFDLLEKHHRGDEFSKEENERYERANARLDRMCRNAFENGVSIYIDAEESWIQDSIDEMSDTMMSRYNKEKAIVYNTFQLYRTDRMDFLKASYDKAQKEGYILGAKLVRGAYMHKERTRAAEMGYPSPIHETKEDTDRDYNEAVIFCVERYKEMASCNATHNLHSNALQSSLIDQMKIDRNHPHLNSSQLYGMSDNITFNLSAAGFNVSKYMVYGKVSEVTPYLIRRAQENSSVTGDISRELHLLNTEVERRKNLKKSN